MAEELQLKIQADISDLQVEYKNIEKLEEERAAKAKILTQQTLALRKKALKEEEAALQSMIAQQEKAGASNREQFQKPIEESTQKIQSLQREITGLGPPMAAATEGTKKLTFGQQQLNKAVKTVQSTLRGFAITAALAFGAAAIKALKEYAQELLHVASAEEKLSEARRKAIPQIAAEEAKVRALVRTAKDLNVSLENRQAAIRELNLINPEHLGNLTLETIGTEEATIAINEYIKATERRVIARVLEKELEDAIIKRREAELDLDKRVRSNFRSFSLQDAERRETAQRRLDNANKEIESINQAIAANAQDQEVRTGLIEVLEQEISLLEARRKAAQTPEEIAALTAQIKAQQEALDKLLGVGVKLAPTIKKAQQELAKLPQTIADVLPEMAKLFGDPQDSESLTARAEELVDQLKELGGEVADLPDTISPEFITYLETLIRLQQEGTEAHKTQALSRRALNKEVDDAEIQGFNDRIEAALNYADALGSLGNTFQSLSQIVGEETRQGAELQKAAAVFSILASQAVAIANAVEAASAAAKSGGPAAPAIFIATLATMLAITIANIAKAKALIDGAKLPQLAEGRSDGPGTMAVVGERGQEIVYIPKGAAVFNNQATRNEREMIEALNDGKIHDYLNKNFIYPAIIAAQAAQKQQDRHEMQHLVKTYLDNAFDDERLHRVALDQKALLKVIAARMKPKPTPAFRSRFG